MSASTTIWGRFGWLVASLVLLAAGLSCSAWADPIGPNAERRQIALNISRLLRTQHLTRHPLDDEIAKRGVRTYLKMLDPAKVYFYQSDIDAFFQQEDQVDDATRDGNIRFGYDVFRVFLDRVDERVAMVDELLAMKHDFTIDEDMVTDPDVAQYAGTKTEAFEKWRKRIKYDLLKLKFEKVEGAEAIEKLSRRYHSFVKRMHQTDGSIPTMVDQED